MDCHLVLGDLTVFGEIGSGCYNALFVFSLKIMEYGLLLSENMLSSMFSETDQMQKMRSTCVCLTSQFHKLGQAFSEDRGSVPFCPF